MLTRAEETRLAIRPVAVKVDHVVGLAFPVGLAEHLPELLERGRTQEVELVGLAVGRAQPAEELARHRAEGHVLLRPRPAEDQEDADLPLLPGWKLGRE